MPVLMRLPGAQMPTYRRPGYCSLGVRWTEKKLFLTSVPCGGKISTCLRKSCFTWLLARRIVAVEAITLGRTRLPFTVQQDISSTAVS